MKDIKLIVCDLDGTLIDRDEIVPDRIKQLTQELTNRRIIFTIVTGRSKQMAQPMLDALSITSPYIINNGAQIRTENQILFHQNFAVLALKESLLKARDYGMSVVFCHANGQDTVLAETPWTQAKHQEFGIYKTVYLPTENDWTQLQLQKIIIIDKDFAIERVSTELSKLKQLNVIHYGNGGIEIMAKDTDKANAVTKLAEHLRIDLSQVLAIGNDQNDIEMLKRCGVGAAVANANSTVKSVADYICQDSLSAGVAEAIALFCPLPPN